VTLPIAPYLCGRSSVDRAENHNLSISLYNFAFLVAEFLAAQRNFRFPEISLDATPTQDYYPPILSQCEGRIRIVRDAGQGAVDAAASGVKRDGRAGSKEPVSDQTAR
jgi:hypothetical protein